MMLKPDGQQAMLAALNAQQLAAALAGTRLALAGQLQLTLLSVYWSDADEAVLDERGVARKIAEAAVMHADALIEAVGRTPSPADGLLRR